MHLIPFPVYFPQVGGTVCIRCIKYHLPQRQRGLCSLRGPRQQRRDGGEDLEARPGSGYSQRLALHLGCSDTGHFAVAPDPELPFHQPLPDQQGELGIGPQSCSQKCIDNENA